MAAIEGRAVICLDSIQHGLSDNKHPGYAHCSIIQIIGIPSLPHLIGQFLINQQGLDVRANKHIDIIAP